MGYRFATLIILIAGLCVGCSTLFVQQELSKNYALEAGVRTDSPEVVDGNLNTISNHTRIMIELPEKKSIRKIVIHSPNISNFRLYQYMGQEGDWKIIKEVKSNKLDEIVINTQVITDKIRMFITDTRGTRFADPGELRDVDGYGNIFSRQVDAPPQVQEIELYGLVDKVEKIKPEGPIF